MPYRKLSCSVHSVSKLSQIRESLEKSLLRPTSYFRQSPKCANDWTTESRIRAGSTRFLTQPTRWPDLDNLAYFGPMAVGTCLLLVVAVVGGAINADQNKWLQIAWGVNSGTFEVFILPRFTRRVKITEWSFLEIEHCVLRRFFGQCGRPSLVVETGTRSWSESCCKRPAMRVQWTLSRLTCECDDRVSKTYFC